MRVDLDAKVRTSDGEDAGSVERAVVDPRTNEVTEFVISTGGLLGREVLVPREEIESAESDGDSLRLRLNKAELERLPTYVADAYGPPPPGWIPPADYGIASAGFISPVLLAPTAPVTAPGAYAGSTAGGYVDGGMAAGASLQGAGAPGAARGNAGSAGGTASGAGSGTDLPQISKGAIVLDRDGQEVGVVDDVRFDQEGGRLRGVVLRAGGTLRTFFGGGETMEVNATEIERVEEEAVRLKITKDALERAR